MRRTSSNSSATHSGRRVGGLRILVLAGFALYGAWYWFSNRSVDPYTGEKILVDRSLDAESEAALGLQAYQEVLNSERRVAPENPTAQQIQAIMQRLVAKVPAVESELARENNVEAQHFSRDFRWEVNVLDSPEVNAFALPGGKMAVYTGLIPVARNADGMAVVMGHEIAHALLRHGAQRMARGKLEQIGAMAGAASGVDAQTQQMIFSAYGVTSQLPYARGHESQADEIGLLLMAAACFNPAEAMPLWQRMSASSGGRSQPEFASTHPSPESRIRHLQSLQEKALRYREKFCETP